MKKQTPAIICLILFLNVFFSGAVGHALTEDKENNSTNDLPAAKQSLMKNGYVLESDDESAAESLERISGKVDMGFSAPEDTFKSDDHYSPGPFALEKVNETK